MASPTAHLSDILSGRKLSSFLLFEDFVPLTSCCSIWPTLCNRLSEKYTCLIVRSELPGSSLPHYLLPNIENFDFWDSSGTTDCLQQLEDRVSMVDAELRPWVIFFENMDAFLLNFPSDQEVGERARFVASYLLSLTTNPAVASIICSLNIYKSVDGENTWSSEQVKDIFEFCATTCVRLTPISRGNKLKAVFWQRRTLDSICRAVRMVPTLSPSNKPAISGRCHLIFDPETHLLVKCINPPTTVKAQVVDELPTSTFKLTSSQAEIEAKKKVVLPYLEAINVGGSVSPLPESTIQYVPDAFDDFDDDDPDDDLDI